MSSLYLKMHFLVNFKKIHQSLGHKNSLTPAVKIISLSSPLIHSFVKTPYFHLLQVLTMEALPVIVIAGDLTTMTVKSLVGSAPVGQMSLEEHAAGVGQGIMVFLTVEVSG